MTETRKPYVVSGLPQGPSKSTLLRFSDPNYIHPTWEEVRNLMSVLDISGSKAGNIVGVDSRTVRKWTCPPDKSGHMRIPYAAWRLLLIYGKYVEPEVLQPGF